MNKDEELCYLMNPTLYDKYKKLSSNEQHVQFIEEKKFYRKRILQMSKDCTRFQVFKDAEVPPKQILTAYNEFAKICKSHFKTEDENEFYQNEYNDIEPNNTKVPDLSEGGPDPINMKNLDTELLANIPTKKVVTMEDFVTKTKTKPQKKLIPPKQKNVNVKDEKYRTKGLKKNKSKD